ncbi:MAG: sensor domain-containing diguanylate cyclase [Candidatus Thiodiazotropha sp. (ex Dulcina madagascariensis)]|nr:sensor domain-containing diguanylate cyclase [Candidatus Thiodiazotropha sp. (ex Dulcina madagascariensis)]MCU7925483.1 sensor domain-containing diguanylate cyclase [Candidatus Thiodiazotropha sp. (ex Dulcina madagascariensis)]
MTIRAGEIISVGRNIRNIGLARNNVITHLFPLAGNEAALGLEYEKVPAQWPAIKQAIDLGGTMVAGPVALVQGGQAFIARTPIYAREDLRERPVAREPAYWGIASIVIDIPTLFDSAGIAPEIDGIQYALRGKDATGARGEMIFGDPALFTAGPVLQSVLLPNGTWQMGALPVGGWQASRGGFWQPRLAGWLGALVIGFLIAALLRARETNKSLALHDHLTGLPNRRLLAERFEQMTARSHRSGKGFGIYYIDLDGFKGVNDRFGHKVGDGLLVEAAKRMQAGIRATDTVARIGGDEFIVLADAIEDSRVSRQVADHLLSNLQGEVDVDGYRLTLHASVGSVLYPGEGKNLDQLLKAADLKMYQVKQRGKAYRLNSG